MCLIFFKLRKGNFGFISSLTLYKLHGNYTTFLNISSAEVKNETLPARCRPPDLLHQQQ